MSEKFAKRWGEGIDDAPLSTRIKEAVRPPGPLKPRLNYAIKRIEMQIQRLDKASARFSERDKSIFARVVDAYSKHDMARANVFANELTALTALQRNRPLTRRGRRGCSEPCTASYILLLRIGN